MSGAALHALTWIDKKNILSFIQKSFLAELLSLPETSPQGYETLTEIPFYCIFIAYSFIAHKKVRTPNAFAA